VNLRARRHAYTAPATSRAAGNRFAFQAALVLFAAFLLGLGGAAVRKSGRHWQTAVHSRTAQISAAESSPNWNDRFRDGTPDFLRLTDPADQAAFRRWFTAIAEYQAARETAELPPEITDCASLVRYSYRETLKRHDGAWFETTGIELPASPGEIHAWHYPDTPLGLSLFRVLPGPFQPMDSTNGSFAQFADAKTLVRDNTYLIGRDVRLALPGDLLFYRQFGHSSPWHSMIITRVGTNAQVVYHTGPDHGAPGELRRVALSDLLDHPQPEWRPLASNPNFLGVYRWNILRGTS
jgi:uncharacterized protein